MYINFRRASGRPCRWDIMTWLLSEIDRRKLPKTPNSAREIVWEAREAVQDDRNRQRYAAWRLTKGALDRAA